MGRVHTITLQKCDGILITGFYPGIHTSEYEQLRQLVEETVTTAEAKKILEEFAAKLRRVLVHSPPTLASNLSDEQNRLCDLGARPQ
jgi:hypothetical protein